MSDPTITELAAVVQSCAEETRAAAGRLVTQQAVDWHSTAAGAYRRRLEAQAARVRHAAGLLDAAVRDLLQLAGAP